MVDVEVMGLGSGKKIFGEHIVSFTILCYRHQEYSVFTLFLSFPEVRSQGTEVRCCVLSLAGCFGPGEFHISILNHNQRNTRSYYSSFLKVLIKNKNGKYVDGKMLLISFVYFQQV